MGKKYIEIICPRCQGATRLPIAAAKGKTCRRCEAPLPDPPKEEPGRPTAAQVEDRVSQCFGIGRAEVYQQVEWGGRLDTTFSVECGSCGTVGLQDALRASDGLLCTCVGGVLRLELTIKERVGGSTTSGLEAVVGLLSLFEVRDDLSEFVDAAEEEQRPERVSYSSVVQGGFSNQEIVTFVSLGGQGLLDAVLPRMRELRVEELLPIAEVVETEGVDCLQCHRAFAPGSVLARRRIAPPAGFFSNDLFCCARCAREFKAQADRVTCPTCKVLFSVPTRPALEDDWEPKPWHEDGYCTVKCKMDEGKQRCLTCDKPFVPPGEVRIGKQRESKPWHLAGFCCKKCSQAPAQPAVKASAKPMGTLEIVAGCPEGHSFRIPTSHVGFRALCPSCKVRTSVR